ncbi:MAG: hypothetical protein NDJ90_05530 [Oligoflexia bacterium]|nr:hypothetical protein [Oligoflexia bacterium]
MRTCFFFASFLILALLSGCKGSLEIRDGALSPELAGLVREGWEGTYEGRFHGAATSLELRLDSDNRVLLESAADLLDPACDSRIGQLLRVVSNGSGVAGAIFAFDPGRCQWLAGRELQAWAVERQGVKSVRLSLLARETRANRCGVYSRDKDEYCNPSAGGVFFEGLLKKK